MTPDQIDTIISAGAGLAGAIIGAVSTLLATWLNKKLQTSGKISLFEKIVDKPFGGRQAWGTIHRTQNRGSICLSLFG